MGDTGRLKTPTREAGMRRGEELRLDDVRSRRVRSLTTNARGANYVEYTVLVALICLLAITGVSAFGQSVVGRLRCFATNVGDFSADCRAAADDRFASSGFDTERGQATTTNVGAPSPDRPAPGAQPDAKGPVPWARFSIKGKKEFERTVRHDLELIASTEIGRKLLDRLERTSRIVTIVEPARESFQYLSDGTMRDVNDDFRGRGPFEKPESSADSTRELIPDAKGDYVEITIVSGFRPPKVGKQRFSLGPPKSGSNATVVLNAAWPDGEPVPAYYQPEAGWPTDATLIHELAHAVRSAEGSAMPHGAPAQDATRFAGMWTNLEEYEVITGIDNPYRIERGLPTRVDHSTGRLSDTPPGKG
jgi:Flp pilus assembly pilin Flp